VCPQPVPVSTESATAVRAQMADVKWTPVSRVTPVSSVSAGRLSAALRSGSVTHMLTATSAREQPGEFTCIKFELRDLGSGFLVTFFDPSAALLGVFVNLVSKVMVSPVWSRTRVLHLSEAAAA